jgi:general secretion pathway protein I
MTPGSRQSGFALIEVLVAFIIAAVALGLLFQAASSSGRAARQAGNYEEAVSLAKSHMAAVGRDADIVASDVTGNDEGSYRFRVTIIPSAVAQPPRDAGPAPVQAGATLFNVAVTVSWTDGSHEREIVLHSQRIATPQAQPNG